MESVVCRAMSIIEIIYDNLSYRDGSDCKRQGEPLISGEGTTTRFSNGGGKSSNVCRQFELSHNKRGG